MSQRQGLIKQGLPKGKEAETDACKMRKVLLVVECEHIPEDSKDRLCLSKVQETRSQALRMFSKKASIVAAKLILSGGLTASFAAWAVEHAFLERGYRAYGGEYLFVLVVFGAMYWALGKLFDNGSMGIL